MKWEGLRMVVWSIGVPKLSARRVGETKSAHTCRQVPSPGLLDLVEERLDGIDRRPSPLTDFLPSPCDLSEFGFTSSARRACLSNSRPLQTKGTLSMFMINMSALLATIGNHAETHDFTISRGRYIYSVDTFASAKRFHHSSMLYYNTKYTRY